MICPQRARKDIICYKVLRATTLQTGHTYYTTPYFGCKVKLNSTLSAKENVIVPHKFEARYRLLYPDYMIEEGYIHCFTNKNVVCEYVYNYLCKERWYNTGNIVIVECIIPKGTLYYKSTNRLEICAKEIFTRGIELQM